MVCTCTLEYCRRASCLAAWLESREEEVRNRVVSQRAHLLYRPALTDKSCYSTGQLTRGMLVVDRREDKSAYAPGANRAFVQAQLERYNLRHGILESTAVPAPVGIECQSERKRDSDGTGIWCVTETPGSDVLVALLLERIWGVSVDGG